MSATKQKLIDATVELMLSQGFGATSVGEICTAAGVSKGAFFHHFEGKEAIAVAAADRFARCNEACFSDAVGGSASGARARLRCLLDFFEDAASDPEKRNRCLVGNLAQEVSGSHEQVRVACCEALERFVHDSTGLFTAAQAEHEAEFGPAPAFVPEHVAHLLTALLQGGMLVGKARGDDLVLQNAVRQFRVALGAWLPGSGLEQRGESCC